MQGVTFWLLCDAVDEWSEQLCEEDFSLGGAGARLIGGVPELKRRARERGWWVSESGGARCPDHAKLRVRRVPQETLPDVTSDDLAGEQLVELSAPEQRACEQCGALYTPKRRDQRFHQTRCRELWANTHKPTRRAERAAR